MARELKTNVMRILEKNQISYEALHYSCDQFIDGVHVADQTGTPHEQSFKTLVARGKSGAFYVFVLPVEQEVDLKKAARVCGEKSVALLHVRELTAVTGYMRGGCSPVGMKKQFPTFYEKSAAEFQEIYISGGRVGLTLKVRTDALLFVTAGQYADFAAV